MSCSGGQHHDGHAGVVAADDIEQGEAVGAGHHDVGEDEVAAGVVLQMEQGLFGVGHRGDVVSAAPKHLHQDAAHRGFVVDHQDVVLPLGDSFLLLRHLSQRRWHESLLRLRGFLLHSPMLSAALWFWVGFRCSPGPLQWYEALRKRSRGAAVTRPVAAARGYVVSIGSGARGHHIAGRRRATSFFR